MPNLGQNKYTRIRLSQKGTWNAVNVITIHITLNIKALCQYTQCRRRRISSLISYQNFFGQNWLDLGEIWEKLRQNLGKSD